jgi:hypothetical protein
MPLTSSARQIHLSKRTRRAGGRRFRVGPQKTFATSSQQSAGHHPSLRPHGRWGSMNHTSLKAAPRNRITSGVARWGTTIVNKRSRIGSFRKATGTGRGNLAEFGSLCLDGGLTVSGTGLEADDK